MTLEQLKDDLYSANTWIQNELAEPVRQDAMPTRLLVAVATLLDAAPGYFDVVKAAKEWRDAKDVWDKWRVYGDAPPEVEMRLQTAAAALRSALAKLKLEEK